MYEIDTDQEIEIPNWDVALEALIKEEFIKQGHELNVEDFHKLSKEYSIRFDDIMETVFALTLEGRWIYLDTKGQEKEITQAMVDSLYINSRLHEDDVRGFKGGWQPVQ